MVTSQRIQQLKEKVALLPDSPGVYQILGDDGKVIYVGKAKNLKRRVSSYFLARADHSPKVRVMVGKIADLSGDGVFDDHSVHRRARADGASADCARAADRRQRAGAGEAPPPQ